MTFRATLITITATAATWLPAPAHADPFSFRTGTADGRLGALSQPASEGEVETETADDFILTETTTISQATIVGLIPSGTPMGDIRNVEVELYHVFPKDSVEPPSGRVPARANSPADVEIGTATRDGREGTLSFAATLLNASGSVSNSVVNGIHEAPNNLTRGDGPATGELVQIAVTFDPPIVLPADHYFFRPEVQVSKGDFLFVSAPRPIVPPGTPFIGDLQAWIRNSELKPDWLRIGNDVIGGSPAPTFEMTFSLAGETVPEAGTPGEASCHGKTVSAVARQFGGIDAAAAALGFSSVTALQDGLRTFCE